MIVLSLFQFAAVCLNYKTNMQSTGDCPVYHISPLTSENESRGSYSFSQRV